MSTTTAKPLKISDTALKFGPEWLRALSHGDTPVSPPPSPGPAPRYKLAQHRYGREEMLALCDRNIKAPDDLTVEKTLYIEKTQLPLALIQASDEEMRMWQRGVNSDVVLKLQGRGTGPSIGSGVGGAGTSATGSVSLRGGRGGGSVDRGRGRGRGLGPAVGSYNRGISYEDEGGEHGRREGGPAGFGRGSRPFERSQSSSERVWIERPDRNGAEDGGWNGTSTSPRKEFGVGRPGGGAGDNWRSREAQRERDRAEGKIEEEDGWRTAGRGERWAGRAGWRSDRDGEPGVGDKREPWVEGGGPGWKEDGSRPAGSSYYPSKRNPNRRWDDGDVLPEWAAEDLQGGGTFDASGAFRDERWGDEDPGSEALRKKRGTALTKTDGDDGGPSSNADAPGSSSPKDGQVPGEKPNGERAPEPIRPVANKSPIRPAEQGIPEQPVAVQRPNSSPPARVDVEDGLEHAQAVVSTLVAQLVEDEDQPPKESPSPPHHHAGMDQWFYRDPQGDVQGPFAAAEMTEWFNSGYFTMALSVRRACDERYVQLGELTKMWGRLPFLSGSGGTPHHPPLKAADVHPMVAEQEKLQLIQQQLMQQQMFQAQMQQMQQQQQHALRQQAVVAKLSQMDGWANLSPVQQQQVVNQHMANLPPLPPPHPVGPVGGDPLLQQLRLQMEAQAKMQAEMLIRKEPVPSLVNHHHHQQQQQQQHLDPAVLEPSVPAIGKPDPIQAFVQQLLGQPAKAPGKPMQNNNNVKHAPDPLMDPIQSLIQQAQWGGGGAGGGPVEQQPLGPLSGVAGGHVAPGFHGLSPGVGLVPWPPQAGLGPHQPPQQQQPPSVWDLESAKVEEAKRMMEHQQHMAAEIHRRDEEEERHRREIHEREEERKRMEELRRDAEQRQQQAEEMRRRELQHQQQQQMAEEKRRRQEEEIMRKQEELKQQQMEEERMRREEEQRLRKEAEQRAMEQQRRQQETLQRLQEQQAAAQAQNRAAQQQAAQQHQQQLQAQAKAAQAMAAPWAQTQKQQQHTSEPSLSMAEIQKLQEEKDAKERAAAQALKAEQNARAAALQLQQQQQAAIKLRWATKQGGAGPSGAAAVSNSTKSLAEIQAEEAAQLARQKEKEAKERATQQGNMNLAAAGAWGSSHHSLSSSAWSSGRTAAAVVAQHPPQQVQPPVKSTAPATTNHTITDNSWKVGSMGFWEDPSPAAQPAKQQATKAAGSSNANKPAAAVTPAAPKAPSAGTTKQAAVATTKAASAPPGSAPATAASNKKNRSNKEEEAVRKLFGQTTESSNKKDSFSNWCYEYLKKVQAPIDVPTFVAFLKDVESPFEVQDYVRSYLGEGKEAKEFAKQFLEQRSRWRQMQRNQQYEEDNMCIPAKAVNPGQASDFHEVKSKSKKSKKKMQKVDASLLGFSVSAPTDRINVGERDFVDGM